MKRGNYFDRNNTIKDSRRLPKGAYICKIVSAKEDVNQYGTRLLIAFDISEGEYAGFYQEKYNASTSEDKKWSGVIRLNVPAEDGSEADAFRIRSFNSAIVAIEESNPGYMWDWNERALKGKNIGVVFNSKEFRAQDGRIITFTQPKRITSVASVKDGTYYVPKDEPLEESTANSQAANDWMSVPDDDADLPFA
jgi:hypothetical protein